ncbi:ecto-ADP-ribosyltransferase 5-like [Gopherus flavomarginatus]|uniref:ecto-ADP-ribosyltransferase 5-like n=1 Tax=Gopherus flavomarginatus TaxID=286002 RepID=UPI0021CC2F5F|nr:ecto-ADP-ribosyltransferase 5-like [Gopherus flavomarginatus]XP_050777733.1 ecto-ADP-ribosyltransferase 5-like [Gopherus flavomarginatus]XP_050777814.1 ecto-ADP-ribosyltransferase 5-like [Gopherus flavomarginatus]
MMPDAFDDQYLGCAEKMYTRAHDLLQTEIRISSSFSRVWKNAAKKWTDVKKYSRRSDIKDEYGIAIVAYTDKPEDNRDAFSTTFNKAVRETGTSLHDYMVNFQFKAFHYYLTRALQVLRNGCNVMYNMMLYRGTKSQYMGSGLVRFGYFSSSSIRKDVAESFGKTTFFTIHSCFGVEIRNLSQHPYQEEVLIPVHEIFNVAQGQGNNHFILRSTNRTCSHFNCAYLGGEKKETYVYNSGKRFFFPHSFVNDSPSVLKCRAESNPTRQTCHMKPVEK